MQSNQTQSHQCDEPDNDHRLTRDYLHKQIEPRGVWFETYEPTKDRWIPIVVKSNRTETSLRQQYGPIRNLTEFVAREDIAEVLDDAC